MVALLCLAWAQSARAEEPQAQLTIAPNGQVMLRGAKVISVEGALATVESSWGATSFRWIVEMTGSTRYVPEMTSVEARQLISAGDVVNLTGELDASRPNPTIIASVLKDMTHYHEGATVGGRVVAVDLKAQTVDIVNDAGTTTIDVYRGTFITKEGDRAPLSAVSVGASVSAVGSLNRVRGVLAAERLVIETETSRGSGFFSDFLSWLEGSRGALSVR